MPPRRTVVLVLIGLAGILVAVIAGTIVVGWSDASHADGQGTLASRNEPGSESMAVDAEATGGTRFTFGMRLCVSEGDSAPIIRRVYPTSTVGTGVATLGIQARALAVTADHTPIISVAGYPLPDPIRGSDELFDVVGYAVTTSCDTDPSIAYTELLVGLERISSEGGGWEGVLVDYTVDGTARTLEIDRGIFICGSAYPACE